MASVMPISQSGRAASRLSFIVQAVILLTISLFQSGCVPVLLGVGTAAVAASTTEKGFSTSVADTVIHTKITDRFIQADSSLVAVIDITVNDGSVLMTGKVKTPEEKITATRVAWEVRGVREVINEIQVVDKSSLREIAKDNAAGAQLRFKLIGDNQISSLNFSIDVVNGIVYLAGIASSVEEMDRVINHARGLRFAKQVVNYITVRTDFRE